MPYFHEDKNSYYYRHWDCDKPRASILLLHGFGEHTGHYHRFAAALVHANFEVWALDHIGHGMTAGTPGQFESINQLADNAKSLANFIQGLSPELPLILCGHSLGGVTAATLAIELGQRSSGLILTGTPFEGLQVIDASIEVIMSCDSAYLDALKHDPLKFDSGPAEPNLWKVISQQTVTLRIGLAKLHTPTLLINGEHDVFAPPELARAWAKKMPNAKALEIPGGYHNIPNDSAHRQVMNYIILAVEDWLHMASLKGSQVPAHPAIS
ncbi:alpha/beta hydrolase [Pseudomonas protegens]